MVNQKLNFFRWKPDETTSGTEVQLVFLHGMGGTGQIWRAIAAQLEDRFDCIAPDQRGHGGSLAPDPELLSWHARDYASDVEALLGDLKVNRCWLIGHSMGVRTALALAHRIPRKIQGLIAVDLSITSEWGGGIGEPLAHFIQALPESFPDRASLKEHLTRTCPDPAIAQYLSAVAVRKEIPSPGSWVFPFQHHALIQTIREAHHAPIEAWLKGNLSFGIPHIFLRGANSRVWLKSDYESQKKACSHPLLRFEEWENCGHGLPFEQRGRMIEFLRATCMPDPINGSR
jgi:pimeloyl-ACP methyl ester carboxylesterase